MFAYLSNNWLHEVKFCYTCLYCKLQKVLILIRIWKIHLLFDIFSTDLKKILLENRCWEHAYCLPSTPLFRGTLWSTFNVKNEYQAYSIKTPPPLWGGVKIFLRKSWQNFSKMWGGVLRSALKFSPALRAGKYAWKFSPALRAGKYTWKFFRRFAPENIP